MLGGQPLRHLAGLLVYTNRAIRRAEAHDGVSGDGMAAAGNDVFVPVGRGPDDVMLVVFGRLGRLLPEPGEEPPAAFRALGFLAHAGGVHGHGCSAEDAQVETEKQVVRPRELEVGGNLVVQFVGSGDAHRREFLVQTLASCFHGQALFGTEIVHDDIPGMAGLEELEPFLFGQLVFGRDDFHLVAALEHMVERDEFHVHLAGDGMMPDLGMD